MIFVDVVIFNKSVGCGFTGGSHSTLLHFCHLRVMTSQQELVAGIVLF